jgi:hypothetical protein
MKDFFRGVLCGVAVCAAIVACYLVISFFYKCDKSLLENMEVQHELQILQEDYGKRGADSFLDDSAVRGAADAGIERIRRKRDEVLQRIRGYNPD